MNGTSTEPDYRSVQTALLQTTKLTNRLSVAKPIVATVV